MAYNDQLRMKKKTLLMSKLRLKQTATYQKILMLVWHGHAESDCNKQGSELEDNLRSNNILRA